MKSSLLGQGEALGGTLAVLAGYTHINPKYKNLPTELMKPHR
ncbi:MAG: hypothetical protein R2792_11150 [Saprospiraceae bacterium]